MEHCPRISIVVIGYNEAENLDNTFSAINNINYPQENVELIYVDSGSKDNSIEIAKKYTDKVYIEDKYPSPGRNRNRGLVEASSNIVHFIDGDVIIDRDYLKNIINLFDEKKVHAIVGQLDEQNPNMYNKISALSNSDKIEGYTNFTSTGATYIKTALLSVNGYDERIRRGQETELGERFRKAGYKIWCTRHKMGSHNFGVKSVWQLLMKAYVNGKSLTQVALMKENGPFFKYSRKIVRNQKIKIAILIPLLAISVYLGNLYIFLSVFVLMFLYQNRNLFKRYRNTNIGLLLLKLIIQFISQFYFFAGVLRETATNIFYPSRNNIYKHKKDMISNSTPSGYIKAV